MLHPFSKEEIKEIESAIADAERLTSGEIRVFIDRYCRMDVMDRAADIFEKLGMKKTELRNGVLFYVSFNDKKFAILGDKGINEKVPDNFWDEIRDEMRTELSSGNAKKALIGGVTKAGIQLRNHFPVDKNDRNELSNEIVFGS